MSKSEVFKEYSEYSTTDVKEVEHLNSNNIKYCFVKVINGATIFKYKKSKQLFEVLSTFRKFN